MTGARLSSAVGEVPVGEAVASLAEADERSMVLVRSIRTAGWSSSRSPSPGGTHDPSPRCAASCGALIRSGLPGDDHGPLRPSQRRTALRVARVPPQLPRQTCRGSSPAPVFSLSRPRALLSGGREFYPRIGTTSTYLHWGARRCPVPARSHGLQRSPGEASAELSRTGQHLAPSRPLPAVLHELLLLVVKGARAAEGCKTGRCTGPLRSRCNTIRPGRHTGAARVARPASPVQRGWLLHRRRLRRRGPLQSA